MNSWKRITVCLFIISAVPAPAYAYIDPGTGSLILQGLAAGLIAVAAFWGRILKALRNLFAGEKRRE